jgi:hypothetical protein
MNLYVLIPKILNLFYLTETGNTIPRERGSYYYFIITSLSFANNLP